MNVLLDFIPFQHNGGVGGAASFTKAVYDRLFMHSLSDVVFYGAYDANVPVGKQYDYRQYANQHHITLVDLSSASLASFIAKKQIDTFFIAIGQFYASYDLTGISCKTIMFIHDLFDLERSDSMIDLIIPDTKWAYIKRAVNIYSKRWKKQEQRIYQSIIPLYNAPNTIAYTVSEYSRNALRYYFPEIKKDIHVCYSPLRSVDMKESIENESLARIVNEKRRFLFLIAANRRYKNASLLLKVYKRILKDYPDLFLLTLKYGDSVHPQHIDIPFLSDSDMEHAYSHAHALVFGSFFEGFGYPPIEAARHGTPTIASNVTSIPEILGDAGLYFSPFYSVDLYRVLTRVLQNRDMRKEAITQRYHQVRNRQEGDLDDLINEILILRKKE